MQFQRKQSIDAAFYPGRVLVVYGPRRVGKTTMLREYLSRQNNKRILFVTGDDVGIQDVFASRSLTRLQAFASSYDIIALDEAQQTPHIGIGAKMLIDAFPQKQIILTGSSSFELAGQVGEPLTGRHFTLTLLPLAQAEMRVGSFELEQDLENFLIYGAYPEILLAPDTATKERLLRELVSSYLYKDVLALDKIKSPDVLRNLTRMIAYQVGQEVSLNELASELHVSSRTVGRYLDLLEKMFVIRKVGGWSRNLRNEITQKAKYYFLDNGIRNAVIDRFTPVPARDDIGALWENFVAIELMKQSVIADRADQYYFWRTHTGVEVDLVRTTGDTIAAIECKWSKEATAPALWTKTYPDSTFRTITRETYLNVLLDDTSVPTSHPGV